MTESEVLQFQNGPTTESAGNNGDDGTHMLKHAENTMAANPKTLDFSPLSEFLVGTAVRMKSKFGYDDALDVVGVHGVGGIWGALATGLLASVAVNSGGANGLFYGNPKQLLIQLIAVMASVSFAFVGSLILLKLTDAIVGLRVCEEDEVIGLDLSQHDENGYALEA